MNKRDAEGKKISHEIQTLDHRLEAAGREREQYGGDPNGKEGLRMLLPLASRPGLVTGCKRQTFITVREAKTNRP